MAEQKIGRPNSIVPDKDAQVRQDEQYKRSRPSRPSLLNVAAIAIVLSSTTGCWSTVGLWKWAAEPVRRSRATSVVRTPEGEDYILISMKECPGRPDGRYALDIPKAWREQPTRASVWGRDILEIATPGASLVPVAKKPVGRRRKLLRLDFKKVVEGLPPPKGCEYGVVYVPGKDCYAAEVFGYDTSKGRWVQLGRASLDPGRTIPGRSLLAIPVTPFSFYFVDTYILIGTLAGMAGEDAGFKVPRYMCDIPRLVRQLDTAEPELRIKTMTRLRRYGLHARAAVPALRRQVQAADAEVRGKAMETLYALSVLDASTLAAMLESEDAGVRSDAANFLSATEAQ